MTIQQKPANRDGTTHVLFSPQDFMARINALVPRPRVNLTRYHEPTKRLGAELTLAPCDRADTGNGSPPATAY